jgi:hypothetical protein
MTTLSIFASFWCRHPNEYFPCRDRFAGTANGNPGADISSSFVPDAEFGRTDADILIVFLSGHGVTFGEPLYDDWYQATEPLGIIGNPINNETITTYRMKEAASPLGCASQWQFCSHSTSACGPLASYYDAISGAEEVFKKLGAESDGSKSFQGERLVWLVRSTYIDTLREEDMLQVLQDNALLSQLGMFDGYQSHIPENEWQLDVTYWFSIFLAALQSSLLQTASGRFVTDESMAIFRPETDSARKLCSNQVCVLLSSLCYDD